MSDIPTTPEEVIRNYSQRRTKRLLWWVPLALLCAAYVIDIMATAKIERPEIILIKMLLALAIGGLLIWRKPTMDAIVEGDEKSQIEKRKLMAEAYRLSVAGLNTQIREQQKDELEELKNLNERLKGK